MTREWRRAETISSSSSQRIWITPRETRIRAALLVCVCVCRNSRKHRYLFSESFTKTIRNALVKCTNAARFSNVEKLPTCHVWEDSPRPLWPGLPTCGEVGVWIRGHQRCRWHLLPSDCPARPSAPRQSDRRRAALVNDSCCSLRCTYTRRQLTWTSWSPHSDWLKDAVRAWVSCQQLHSGAAANHHFQSRQFNLK